jgi:molecular chaperone HtpG
LRSLSQGDVDFAMVPLLEQSTEPEQGSVMAQEATIIAAVKEALGERVAEVRSSKRLTDSAACLVAASMGMDRELERLLGRQGRAIGLKPVLELNMRHPLLKSLSQANDAARSEDVADLSLLLFEEAQILDGEVPNDPAQFAARVNRLVARAQFT